MRHIVLLAYVLTFTAGMINAVTVLGFLPTPCPTRFLVEPYRPPALEWR